MVALVGYIFREALDVVKNEAIKCEQNLARRALRNAIIYAIEDSMCNTFRVFAVFCSNNMLCLVRVMAMMDTTHLLR